MIVCVILTTVKKKKSSKCPKKRLLKITYFFRIVLREATMALAPTPGKVFGQFGIGDIQDREAFEQLQICSSNSG